MQTLSQLAAANQLTGKQVLIRADLNVPQDDRQEITDDTRIRASLKAVQMALEAGAAVIVCSHLGRPVEGMFNAQLTLQPVARRLSELLDKPVNLLRDWLGGVHVEPGQVVMLENCRFSSGEKENSPELSKQIAALCDVYVNDAFATAHRAEATTEGVGHYAPIVCAGPLLEAELNAINKALQNPVRPLTAVVGGSKVSTKLTILETLAAKVDFLIVGGGIANTFLLATGKAVGNSLVEPDLLPQARAIMDQMQARGAAVPLPSDLVVAKEFAEQAQTSTIGVAEVAADDIILDIGPQSAQRFAEQLSAPGTIVWNGPIGVFEMPQFARGTELIARGVAQSQAYSLAGGGDTIAAINKFGISGIDYISTGGGAFLEILEGRKLPAIAMLEQRSKN